MLGFDKIHHIIELLIIVETNQTTFVNACLGMSQVQGFTFIYLKDSHKKRYTINALEYHERIGCKYQDIFQF